MLFRSLVADEGISMKTKGQFELSADGGAVINGGSSLSLQAGIIRLGPGSKPMMRQGDLSQVFFPYTPMVASAVPMTLFAVGLTGSSQVYG